MTTNRLVHACVMLNAVALLEYAFIEARLLFCCVLSVDIMCTVSIILWLRTFCLSSFFFSKKYARVSPPRACSHWYYLQTDGCMHKEVKSLLYSCGNTNSSDGRNQSQKDGRIAKMLSHMSVHRCDYW